MISPILELPQQNGVVERKNRTLQEMARTMINETNMAKHFWAEAVNTTCYIQNRVSISPFSKRLLTNCGKTENPTFHISILLDALAIF